MTDYPTFSDAEAPTAVDRPVVKLPIATTFCAAEVPLFDGLSFFIDGNSKITRENGTYTNPKPNAFSLPAASVEGAGDTTACPGSTSVCRDSCYVKGLAKHAPELYGKYLGNAHALAQILAKPGSEEFSHSAMILADWIEENAAAGFRWHVSGDVQSLVHARWIVEVCSLAPEVPFWIYTRTLRAVGTLRRAPNLAVNVSADRENFTAASLAASAHGVRLCYLADKAEHDWRMFRENAPAHCDNCGAFDIPAPHVPPGACLPDLPPGSVIFPDYALRGRALADPTSTAWWQSLTHAQRAMVCGTDFFGQSEAHRCGPCRKCF
jgi:hypothetical protein